MSNKFNAAARIRVLVTKNPKKLGTAAHKRFALYRNGMTPDEFLRLGGWREDLRYDEAKGFIYVGEYVEATTAAPKANRAAAVGRIRALLAKTVTNGCTEQEAMAAAEMAGKLMDKYGIESSEAEIREEVCVTGSHGGHRARPHEVQWCAKTIAAYCNCKVWHKTGTGQIRFFGLPSDVEVATYIMRVLEGTANRSYAAYRKTSAYAGARGERNTFMIAFTNRVNARLGEMLRARHQDTLVTTSGTSLMVVKNAVVEEQFTLKLAKAKNRNIITSNSSAAREAGHAAGDRVHLGTAVNDGSAKLRLA